MATSDDKEQDDLRSASVQAGESTRPKTKAVVVSKVELKDCNRAVTPKSKIRPAGDVSEKLVADDMLEKIGQNASLSQIASNSSINVSINTLGNIALSLDSDEAKLAVAGKIADVTKEATKQNEANNGFWSVVALFGLILGGGLIATR